MEGSINPIGFDIASVLGKLTNARSPTKSMIADHPSATLNQQIRDIITHYASVASTSAAQKLAVAGQVPDNHQQEATFVASDEGQSTSGNANLMLDQIKADPSMAANGENDELSEAKSRGTRQIHCSECPRILLSRKNFIKHAEDEHGMVLPIIYRTFETQQEFDKWISYLREERNTEFVSKCGRKRLSNGSLLGYLVCAKSGSEAWKSRKKTAKSLKTCSAYLKVLRNELTGRIEIEGCLDHTGHEYGSGAGRSDEGEQNGNGWLGEGVPFHEVCAQIEARRVGEASYSSYLNCQQQQTGEGDVKVQVDLLNSNSLDPNTLSEAMITNFLTMLKQKDFQHPPADLRPQQQPTPDNTASSSTEVVQKGTMNMADRSLTNSSIYVNVELERRKLALLEQFQITIKQVNEHTIDGAEDAMKCFLRDVEALNKA